MDYRVVLLVCVCDRKGGYYWTLTALCIELNIYLAQLVIVFNHWYELGVKILSMSLTWW